MSFFADHYQRPDLDQVRAESQRLAAACAGSESPEALLRHLGEWNRVRAKVDTQYNIAMVRYSQSTQDAGAKAEQDFWNSAAPVTRELDVLYARTLVESRYGDAIDDAFGPQLRALLRCQATTFVPQIREALVEEARLVSEYTRLTAESEVAFRGQKISLSELRKYYADDDRQTRADSHHAQERFLAERAEALDSIYARLVELRHQMAKALGFDSFTPLGYQLLGRVEYGPDEVAAFRRAIVEEIVPIEAELRAVQARDLGVERLLYHDELTWEVAGNPRPIGDSATILDNAQQMYRELNSEMSDFFALMRDKNLLDVELRDGKAGGGFCTVFLDLGLPFIFANFNGSDSDIMVITHECGHAFQTYCSRHLEPRVEYAFPTYEACEVHSTSLEFLTYPWMELFFGDRGESYRRVHLRKSIALLTYTALVDHFQHEVYAHPGWTPAERNQCWTELEGLYTPYRDYGGMYPYLQKGAFWQRQRHIYNSPFYYIDYALAGIGAMQMWQKAASDRERAMADYLAICRAGGSVSFLEMLELGNLGSPFDPECIRDVASYLRSAIAR